jgi:acyl-CoA thioesterase-1
MGDVIYPSGRRERSIVTGLAFVAAGVLGACGGRGTQPGSGAQPSVSPPAMLEEGTGPLVAFLGDSLTAGHDIPEQDAYPAVVGRMLAAEGIHVRTLNAGVSGDTSAGGLRRIDWVLRQHPIVVVVALGGNDGLRGLDLVELEDNLRRIVAKIHESRAKPILAGIKLPPNYGRHYTRRFDALFPRLAKELDVPFIPFLLAGVAGKADMTLADGIHPNAAAHRVIAATVLPFVLAQLPASVRKPDQDGPRHSG